MRPSSVRTRLPALLATAPALCLALAAPAAAPVHAQATPQAPCADDPDYAVLDFWVGEWDVYVGSQQVGSNRIEKVMDGCAVTEHWSDARGGRGTSFFYRVPWTDEWKQVWITPGAAGRGGTKEKSLVARLGNGGVRFRGRVPDAAGAFWYDRTTLTPRDDGSVEQHIEISRDGETWQTTFRAIYRRRGSG